jgi:hypothetical protein
MALDQRLAHHRVVREQRGGEQQHQVAAGGGPLTAEQLVGQEHQHPAAGERHAGHLPAGEPLDAARCRISRVNTGPQAMISALENAVDQWMPKVTMLTCSVCASRPSPASCSTSRAAASPAPAVGASARRWHAAAARGGTAASAGSGRTGRPAAAGAEQRLLHREVGAPDRATTSLRLVFATAAAQVDGFSLTMAMSRVTGIPAHLQLRATQGDAAELPDDLLAVLGHSWARLVKVRDGWTADLRLKGHMPERGDDAETKFDRTLEHLAQTLAEPPAAFHDKQRRARWRVVGRRAVPLAASLALIGGAFAVPSLQLAQDSVLRMLIFHAPPILLVGFFCLRELPRIEIPSRPKPLRLPAWRAAPENRGPD